MAAAGNPRVAWLSVDELDDDLAHFWSYLVASLQRHEPTVGVEALDLVVDAENQASLEAVESLATDMTDLDRPITLILDDLHRVRARPVLHAIDYLIRNLPADLRVILSTRVDPPLSLPRLRARGELLELRQSDLAFTEHDAEIFFLRCGELRLAPALVHALTERTEGWIAGLQLAALSLRGEQDPEAFVRRFAGPHPTVSDYLLGEVLERQPPDIHGFLLATSILGELDASLCDAITNRSDSHSLLRSLEAQNLFLLSTDASGHSYRYHHLFAGLLQSELRASDRAAWCEAHRRAADWYAAEGRTGDALDHLVTAGLHDRALDLLIERAMSYYDDGQAKNLLRWIDRFPPSFFDSSPKRMLDLASVLCAGGRYAEAGRCLELVENVFAAVSELDPVQRARLPGIRSVWAGLQGDAAESITWAGRAIDCYSPDADDGYLDRLPDWVIRSWGWLDDPTSAWAARRRSYPFPPVPESVARFLTPATLSQIRFIEGHLAEADRLADEALAFTNPNGPDHPALTEARLTRGGVHLERDELDEAEREFETALRQAESDGRIAFLVIASLGLARTWAATGRRDEAVDLITSCRRANRPLALPEPFATRVDVAEARVLIERAPTETGRLIARLPAGPGPSFLRVRLALAQGKRREAEELLARTEQAVTTPRRRLEWQLLDARTRSATSEGSLRSALELAASEGFIRCLLDEGEELLPLLHEHAGPGPAWFVQDVLAAFETSSRATAPRGEGLVEPLSQREQVVLSYLPSWVSSNEIAAELYISLNTLKSHLRSIYRKLGASSRREAVVLARSRGLL
jgi:LuxR family maltose regulon positive regulatory protein